MMQSTDQYLVIHTIKRCTEIEEAKQSDLPTIRSPVNI
jgi:hypothetical protein